MRGTMLFLREQPGGATTVVMNTFLAVLILIGFLVGIAVVVIGVMSGVYFAAKRWRASHPPYRHSQGQEASTA